MNDLILKRIEDKLDILLNSNTHRINEKRYITAREVQDLTGLNQRTILNRSNLDEYCRGSRLFPTQGH